jgi:LacI family transcriptional regulator
MAVTVKQIAELANVSRGTVDRVLNKRGNAPKSFENRKRTAL